MKKIHFGVKWGTNIRYRSEYHFKNFIWFNSLPSDLIDEMNEKFDRKSAESTKLMKFGRQVESNALNAMVNVSFRSSSSNGRNGQLAGACEAPSSTRVGGASFFKNWKLILRSGRWRGHVSGRSDRLCGQFEQLARIFVSDAAAGSWLAASNFPKNSKTIQRIVRKWRNFFFQLISSLAAEGLLECNTPALKSRKMNSKNIRIFWQSPTGHTKYGNNWPPNFLFYSIQRPPHSLGHSFACRHQHFFRRFPVKKQNKKNSTNF